METDKIMAVVNQITKKEEHLPTEWKQPVTGEENKFIQALEQNTIAKSTVEDLKNVLRLVMVKVGLRAQNFPNDLEKQVLIEHIISQYGNHTPEEIKLAFDMAIIGKLDIEEKNVTCYENFSCLYFSTIMNAYRKWARETHSQLKKDYPKMIEEKVILTDEDKAEWLMEWKSMSDINIELIPLIFYDFLDGKNQKGEKILTITGKQKNQYLELAAQQIKSKLFEDISTCKTNDAYIAFNKFENMEKNGFEGEFKGRILNRAKRLIVYDYLKDKIQ